MRAALRSIPAQVRVRPLACFSVAFLLGLLLRESLALPTVACAAALLAAAGLWLCLALRGCRRAALALMLLTGLLAGMTRMGLALDARRTVESIPSAELVGRVASEPFTNPDTGRRIFRFELETVDGRPSDLALRMYLRTDDDAPAGAMPPEAVDYGQRLRLIGHLWAADPVTNPCQFDFGDYLARQGLDAYGTAKMEDVTLLDTARDLRRTIIEARRALARRIDALFPRSAAIMRALVLGDRSMISDELRAAMNRSGAAHLISISGLHVTVLSSLLAFLLSRFMSRHTACIVAAALLLPYGALIGFTASFVRALAMFAILSLAPVVGLPSDAITRLCAVLLGWLLFRPLSVGDTGFALSFSACAGILLLMPPLLRLTGVEALARRRLIGSVPRRALRRLAEYVLTVLCASLAAQLATLPAVVAFFGVQSVVSVPFNLICVPLCMLGYVLGIAALLLSAVSMPLAALLARAPDALFMWLTAITRFSLEIPAASVRIGRYPFALVAVHWLIAAAASDLCAIPARRRRLLPLGLIGVAALSSLLIFAGSWSTAIVFLDAGQGDSAVIRSRGHTCVIDTGDVYSPVADYLNGTCLHLDSVVLSHPHIDHAGGLSNLLNSFCPDAIYLPKGWSEVGEVAPEVVQAVERAREMGAEIRELAAGDAVQLTGDIRMDVFSPEGDALPESVNDLSLLALITCRGQRALFTGDLSAEGEPLLIPDIDVLKVAHHGSDRATSERLLAACTPEIAVISVGENAYGHPGDRTVARLAASGARVLQTRQCGAITLTLRGGAWRVDTFLEAKDEVE